MRAVVIKPTELGAGEIELWRRMWSRLPYPTPCLRPELFIAIAEHQPAIRIAVIERDGRIVGFLPYLLSGERSVAKSIPGCDYEALISPEEETLTNVLSACALKAWQVGHFLGDADGHDVVTCASPIVDLSRGFDAYLSDMASRGISFSVLERKRKRLVRDRGPVSFCRDLGSGAIEMMLQWQCRRFGHPQSWVRSNTELLVNLMQSSAHRLGSIWCMRAGDESVHLQYGLQAGEVFHIWFRAFNPEFDYYSPGGQADLLLASEAKTFGATVLDYGPGGEAYKYSICNGSIEGLAGWIDRDPLRRAGRRLIRSVKRLVRGPPQLAALVTVGRTAFSRSRGAEVSHEP